MPEPRDVETKDVHIKIRKDLVDQVLDLYYANRLATKTEAWERVLEKGLQALKPA